MSDFSIYMKIASASSSRSGIFASVSSQVGQKDDVLVYNQPTPSILDTKPATTGASIVSVVAANLDKVGTSVMMRFKMTAVESTMWVSNSVLLDRACAGLGGNSCLFVSVHMQSGSLTMSVTYRSPVTIFDTAHVVPTSVLSSLTIVGSSLGAFGSSQLFSRIGFSNTEASYWIASSCMSSKIAATYGSRLFVIVTAAFLSLETTNNVSFSPISISSIATVCTPTSGSVSMTLFGSKFGVFDVSAPNSRLGHSSSLRSTWISDYALSSKAASNALILEAISVSFGVKISSIATNIYHSLRRSCRQLRHRLL